MLSRTLWTDNETVHHTYVKSEFGLGNEIPSFTNQLIFKEYIEKCRRLAENMEECFYLITMKDPKQWDVWEDNINRNEDGFDVSWNNDEFVYGEGPPHRISSNLTEDVDEF